MQNTTNPIAIIQKLQITSLQYFICYYVMHNCKNGYSFKGSDCIQFNCTEQEFAEAYEDLVAKKLVYEIFGKDAVSLRFFSDTIEQEFEKLYNLHPVGKYQTALIEYHKALHECSSELIYTARKNYVDKLSLEGSEKYIVHLNNWLSERMFKTSTFVSSRILTKKEYT